MAVEQSSSPFKQRDSNYGDDYSCSASARKRKTLTPGKEFRHTTVKKENITIPPRNDIREQGPLAKEYAQRFKKHHSLLTIPKKPVKMEWFEEDELAKAIYEIMMAETDLEIMKR